MRKKQSAGRRRKTAGKTASPAKRKLRKVSLATALKKLAVTPTRERHPMDARRPAEVMNPFDHAWLHINSAIASVCGVTGALVRAGVPPDSLLQQHVTVVRLALERVREKIEADRADERATADLNR